MRVCVRDCKVHVFQVVYLCRPVKVAWAEGFLLCCKCTEQNHHFDCSGMQTQRTGVRVSSRCGLDCTVRVCVGGGLRKEEREKRTWELAPFGTNANVL